MLELVGIPAAARKRAGGYSMGMRQRLGLAAALLGDPKAVILDEPANGLDPEGIRWLRGFLRHLSGEGKTVLISSHLLAEVDQTVDDVVIIANGRSVAQGPISDLQRRADRAASAPPTATRWPARSCAAGVVSEQDEADGPARPHRGPGPDRRRGPAGRRGRPRAADPLHGPRVALLRADDVTGEPQPQPRGDAGARTPNPRSEPKESVMIRSIKSELLKFFTTRMWWGMAIAIVLAGAGFALLFGFIFTSDAATGGQGGPPPITNDLDLARQVFTGGIGVGYLLTLAIGVMTIGSEYRHKTVTSTFLANPKRVQVMGAKVVALLVIGAMYAVLSLVGSVVTGGLLLTAKGHAPRTSRACCAGRWSSPPSSRWCSPSTGCSSRPADRGVRAASTTGPSSAAHALRQRVDAGLRQRQVAAVRQLPRHRRRRRLPRPSCSRRTHRATRRHAGRGEVGGPRRSTT